MADLLKPNETIARVRRRTAIAHHRFVLQPRRSGRIFLARLARLLCPPAPLCTRAPMPSATATPLRFVDRAHVLLSDGWVVRAASHRVLTDAASPLLAAPNATAKKQRASVSRSKLGTRRGKQRWSALVSAPSSRLAKTMCARLGDAHWLAFVRHANRHYKAAYVRAFEQRILRCAGPIGGGACPHAFEVDLGARDATLEHLHLDHERPVHLTCAAWSATLPASPRAWDDGIDGGALCHALFGVHDDEEHGARCLRFRCGPRRGVRFAHHAYCHVS